MNDTVSTSSSKKVSSIQGPSNNDHQGHYHSSLGSMGFDPTTLHDSKTSFASSSSAISADRMYASTSSLDYRSSSSAINNNSNDDDDDDDELNFLTKSPGSRRWKNKRFWKTPHRMSAATSSSTSGSFCSSLAFLPDAEDLSKQKRRSTIRDSLKGLMMDDMDAPLEL